MLFSELLLHASTYPEDYSTRAILQVPSPRRATTRSAEFLESEISSLEMSGMCVQVAMDAVENGYFVDAAGINPDRIAVLSGLVIASAIAFRHPQITGARVSGFIPEVSSSAAWCVMLGDPRTDFTAYAQQLVALERADADRHTT
jgi:hypothetical protein